MLYALLLACVGSKDVDSAAGETASSDTGSDSASEDSGDTSRDSGADTGGDLPPLEDDFCAQSFSQAPPTEDCLESETLACGDVVEGTLDGGGTRYGASSWEGWACTVNASRHGYDGPERAWRLSLPERTSARLVLDTPCADLDVFVLYWPTDSCPTPDTLAHVCEAGDGSAAMDVARVGSVNAEQDLVFIDGKDGATGNFRLSVVCD